MSASSRFNTRSLLRGASALLALGLACAPALAQRVPKAPARAPVQAVPAASYQPSTLKGVVTLDQKLLLQLLVGRSAEIAYSKVQIEVAGQLSAAEAALYEMVFFTSLRKDGTLRQRSVEERIASVSTSNLTLLNEQVRTAETGVRGRLASGADLSLSYRLRERRNNIIASAAATDTEYDGAIIVALKQPLLKGYGRSVTETDLRVARAEQLVSTLQYEQQLMKTCNDALGVYWQLYRALEVKKIRDQALEYARLVGADTRARIDAGKLPSSNSIEAKAAVLLREVEQIRAVQGVREAESRLQTLLNISGLDESGLSLVVREGAAEFSGLQLGSAEQRYRRALDSWPALRIAHLRAEQAGLRLDFAASQRLPTLDLVLSHTNTGLANSNSDARQLSETGQYPEWSIGVNFDIPLEGGQKARAQYRAQAARVQQAQIELDSIRNALANDIRTKWEQAVGGRDAAARMGQAVELRSEILRIEKVRYDAGLGLLSQLLQRESELSDSRQRLVESNTRLGQANEALLFADGSMLRKYGITVKE